MSGRLLQALRAAGVVLCLVYWALLVFDLAHGARSRVLWVDGGFGATAVILWAGSERAIRRQGRAGR
jgi:hypothetical protein